MEFRPGLFRSNGAAGDAGDIDGQTERSKWAGPHESTWASNKFQLKPGVLPPASEPDADLRKQLMPLRVDAVFDQIPSCLVRVPFKCERHRLAPPSRRMRPGSSEGRLRDNF